MTLHVPYEFAVEVNRRVTDGAGAVRDAGLIVAACERPKAGVYGDEAYPGIWEKAAALLQSLACNHGFTDGNKRTAWVVTEAFLKRNGHPLELPYDQRDAEALVLAVATGKLRDVPSIASALVKFSK